MRYASLAFVFVNIPFEIDCKDTTFISFSKIYFLHVRKNPYLCTAFYAYN